MTDNPSEFDLAALRSVIRGAFVALQGCGFETDGALLVACQGRPYRVRVEQAPEIDVHRAHASAMFNVPYAAVTDEQRRRAKVEWFHDTHGRASAWGRKGAAK